MIATLLLLTAWQVPPAAAKSPVPPAAEQKKISKTIREIYKTEYAAKTPAELQTLVQTLVTESETAEPPARYVFLTEARDLAVRIPTVDGALEASDRIGRLYEVDATAETLSTLELLKKSVKIEADGRKVTQGYQALIERAAAIEDYPGAIDLCKKAEPTARALKDAGGAESIKERRKELEELQKEVDAVKTAMKTLETTPDDPAANLTIGLYRCFTRDDWKAGLPHLKKSGDQALIDLAAMEEPPPTKTAAQTALGDAWVEASKKAKTKRQKSLYEDRGATWYQSAIAGATPAEKGPLRIKIDAIYTAGGGPPRTLYTFVDAQSMPPQKSPWVQGTLPRQKTDDATGVFRKEPIYFRQGQGLKKEVVYQVRSNRKYRQLQWKGSAAFQMTIEVVDAGGRVVAKAGPYGGGNVPLEHTLDFPPQSVFTLRFGNEASVWYFIESVELR